MTQLEIRHTPHYKCPLSIRPSFTRFSVPVLSSGVPVKMFSPTCKMFYFLRVSVFPLRMCLEVYHAKCFVLLLDVCVNIVSVSCSILSSKVSSLQKKCSIRSFPFIRLRCNLWSVSSTSTMIASSCLASLPHGYLQEYVVMFSSKDVIRFLLALLRESSVKFYAGFPPPSPSSRFSADLRFSSGYLDPLRANAKVNVSLCVSLNYKMLWEITFSPFLARFDYGQYSSRWLCYFRGLSDL